MALIQLLTTKCRASNRIELLGVKNNVIKSLGKRSKYTRHEGGLYILVLKEHYVVNYVYAYKRA